MQPTFVLFDKAAVSCKKPIAQPLSEDIRIENDQDAYYVWLYPNPQSAPSSQQLAMRLKTPTHQYHYVRLPVPFPVPWTGWPSSIQFNVTEDMVDGLAGEATDTLLVLNCGKRRPAKSGALALTARASDVGLAIKKGPGGLPGPFTFV